MSDPEPIPQADDAFEDEWAAGSPDEKIEFGLRILDDIKRFIAEGADLDPKLITEGEKVIENYRRAKIDEKAALENLRIARIESKLAQDQYLNSLNNNDIPHV